MIKSFRDKRSEAFAQGESVKEFQAIEAEATRQLSVLNAAVSLDSLKRLPGTRLEKLTADRKGQFSIRINQHWRICFEWKSGEGGPGNVEITSDP